MKLLVCLICVFAVAQPLPLPVKYDPFALSPKPAKKRSKRVPKRSVEPPRWHLMAIYGKRAFINGRFVQEGESIGGFKVVRVKEGSVVLERGGVRKILYFTKPIVKMERR